MDDPGTFGSEQHQGSSEEFCELRTWYAHELTRRSRGVGERSQQVEGRSQPQLAARLGHVLHRGVKRRGEKESDARLCKAALHHCGGAETRTPSASNTSALPERLDTDRFPCFAPLTPHAATTTAALDEILKVPARSPPVPHVSKTRSYFFVTCTACARIA